MQTTTYRMGKLKVVLCIVHGTIFNILGKTIKENNIKKNVCMCVIESLCYIAEINPTL